MKTIDTKSLLLGILATSLIFTLTSGKIIESDNNDFEFFSPSSITSAIYNKKTKTIYVYLTNAGAKGMEEFPNRIYKVAEDGSSLSRK